MVKHFKKTRSLQNWSTWAEQMWRIRWTRRGGKLQLPPLDANNTPPATADVHFTSCFHLYATKNKTQDKQWTFPLMELIHKSGSLHHVQLNYRATHCLCLGNFPDSAYLLSVCVVLPPGLNGEHSLWYLPAQNKHKYFQRWDSNT